MRRIGHACGRGGREEVTRGESEGKWNWKRGSGREGGDVLFPFSLGPGASWEPLAADGGLICLVQSVSVPPSARLRRLRPRKTLG